MKIKNLCQIPIAIGSVNLCNLWRTDGAKRLAMTLKFYLGFLPS